jgi:DNA modification methylase
VEDKKSVLFKIDSPNTDNVWEGFSMNYFSQRELEKSEGIIHPTMKPLRMIGQFIKNSSKPHDIVTDWCGGSGATLIACEQIQRKCRMMEIDPLYCNAIIERWEKFTGKLAKQIN